MRPRLTQPGALSGARSSDCAEELFGRLEAAEGEVNVGQVAVKDGPVGFQADGALDVLDGGSGVAALVEEDAEEVPGAGEEAVVVEDLAIEGLGRGQVAGAVLVIADW